MKKQTIPLEDFKSQLERIAIHVIQEAHFDEGHELFEQLTNNQPLHKVLFSCGEPSHVPTRGRGNRLSVSVGWMWFYAVLNDVDGAAMIASKISTLPGVEQVSAPSLDTQFRAFWGVDVVLRISQ
ncbi:MAG: hypothetical protein ACI8RZ_005132 [Myxococcota bacterium]|jgi:hypothetical protein